jgi:hypothetical protein
MYDTTFVSNVTRYSYDVFKSRKGTRFIAHNFDQTNEAIPTTMSHFTLMRLEIETFGSVLFPFDLSICHSQYSYRLMGSTIRGSNPGTGDFSLLQILQTGSGDTQSPIQWAPRFFPGG